MCRFMHHVCRLMRRTPVSRRHAPLPGQSADDADELSAMSEAQLGSDELGRLSSSIEVTRRPTKPYRSSSSDAHAEVLVRDSDAVASVFYPEQRTIGALLSTADGGCSALCYVLQALCVGYGALNLTVAHTQAKHADMAEPNAQLYVGVGLGGLAWASLALVIGSARDALRSGGALEQLKVGEVMISEKDGTTLCGGAWVWVRSACSGCCSACSGSRRASSSCCRSDTPRCRRSSGLCLC